MLSYFVAGKGLAPSKRCLRPVGRVWAQAHARYEVAWARSVGMPDVLQPSVRIQRVTTRRRSLRTLQCPLEPELLVAEFAGELPPDVALAVREHIAVCETCGARSQALRAPYELLSSLGHEPVATVPDLRDTVRKRAGRGR